MALRDTDFSGFLRGDAGVLFITRCVHEEISR